MLICVIPKKIDQLPKIKCRVVHMDNGLWVYTTVRYDRVRNKYLVMHPEDTTQVLGTVCSRSNRSGEYSFYRLTPKQIRDLQEISI